MGFDSEEVEVEAAFEPKAAALAAEIEAAKLEKEDIGEKEGALEVLLIDGVLEVVIDEIDPLPVDPTVGVVGDNKPFPPFSEPDPPPSELKEKAL